MDSAYPSTPIHGWRRERLVKTQPFPTHSIYVRRKRFFSTYYITYTFLGNLKKNVWCLFRKTYSYMFSGLRDLYLTCRIVSEKPQPSWPLLILLCNSNQRYFSSLLFTQMGAFVPTGKEVEITLWEEVEIPLLEEVEITLWERCRDNFMGRR